MLVLLPKETKISKLGERAELIGNVASFLDLKRRQVKQVALATRGRSLPPARLGIPTSHQNVVHEERSLPLVTHPEPDCPEPPSHVEQRWVDAGIEAARCARSQERNARRNRGGSN